MGNLIGAWCALRLAWMPLSLSRSLLSWLSAFRSLGIRSTPVDGACQWGVAQPMLARHYTIVGRLSPMVAAQYNGKKVNFCSSIVLYVPLYSTKPRGQLGYFFNIR